MSGSPGTHRNRHRLAVAFLYVFIFGSSAFLHHDFACRHDSRMHCIACSVSQAAQKVDSKRVSGDVTHRVAGHVELRPHDIPDAPFLAFVSDRAPPA
jgi:hypothetical protein